MSASGRGGYRSEYGVGPAATRLQNRQNEVLRRAGLGPRVAVTWRSSYAEVVAEFTRRPLAAGCSCDACRGAGSPLAEEGRP